MASRSWTRLRRGIRGAALLAYLAVGTSIPLLHAGTEVLRSETSVESGHTQACPILHGGDACTLATAVQDSWLGRTPVRMDRPRLITAAPPPYPTPDTARHRERQHPVRAPPTV